ncbi:hypothetical protein ACP70R_046216 [Stipagrostis hirtigluma subsp. patula]
MAMELPAWISPGMALFVLLNVLVGAIAVTSRGKLGGPAASGRRLCRSASSMVFDRLRSFSMFSAHPAAEWYHTSPEAEELPVTPAAPETAVQAPATTAPPSSPGAADAAASEPEQQEESMSLNEAKLHREQPPPQPSPPAAAAETSAAVERSGKKEAAMVAPEATKRRARAGVREAAEEVLEEKTRLNARAEQFIQQFREDLKLQRLNSIINYTRGLRRFAGAAPAH